MQTKTLACVVGARPNFVKMAPILNGLASVAPRLRPVLVHTGQHYDAVMSDLFFRQLGLPTPDVHLEVGSGRHGAQTARVLERFEAWLLEAEPRPCATLVVGDVNSTVACAMASVKLGIPVIHVEAGLRSFDREMPEEINRVLTDAISDLMLVTEKSGIENLRHEGRPKGAVKLVGNVMIDALERQLPEARALEQPRQLGLEPGGYVLTTVHRPSNVDERRALGMLIEALGRVAMHLPVIWPIHPRTRARMKDTELWHRAKSTPNLRLEEPLGYLEFLGLSADAKMIVTDSGGIQEEATALGVPCLTLRENTERPATVEVGTNTLVGDDYDHLLRLVDDVLAGRYKTGTRPPLWDGEARMRVAKAVRDFVDDLPTRA